MLLSMLSTSNTLRHVEPIARLRKLPSVGERAHSNTDMTSKAIASEMNIVRWSDAGLVQGFQQASSMGDMHGT